MIKTNHAGLTCTVVDDTTPSDLRAVLVLCHGYGAPGTDLVGLADELVQQRPEIGKHVRMVFPQAPIDLGPGYFGGRAWWHIDVGRFAQARTPQDMLALAANVPEGLKEVRRSLRAALEDILATSGLPMSKVVLGGFSQGSMLATDVAARLEESPAALVLYSGAPIAIDEWTPRLKRRAGLKVVQTHGRQDEVLPFFVGEALHALLTDAGLDVTFTPFDGPHTISADGLNQLADLLVQQIAQP